MRVIPIDRFDPGPCSASWLSLQGAANGRDLGGLPLSDGGVTRPGVLLRTDNLQGLTADDVRLLVSTELSVRGSSWTCAPAWRSSRRARAP